MSMRARAVKLIVKNCIHLMLVIAMNSFAGNRPGSNVVRGALLQFEDFYSQSFVPNGLHIGYRIANNVSIYYNVSAHISFPGKILCSIFVRRAADADGAASQNMLKYRNLDFCKTIESMRNFTAANFNSDALLQATFINSCPLTRGFYYIANGTVDDGVVPLYFTSGRYWIQIELVQVFGEVTKLFNVKVKVAHEQPDKAATAGG